MKEDIPDNDPELLRILPIVFAANEYDDLVEYTTDPQKIELRKSMRKAFKNIGHDAALIEFGVRYCGRTQKEMCELFEISTRHFRRYRNKNRDELDVEVTNFHESEMNKWRQGCKDWLADQRSRDPAALAEQLHGECRA